MKRIIENELYGNLYMRTKQTLDNADIAFLCMIGKANDIRQRRMRL